MHMYMMEDEKELRGRRGRRSLGASPMPVVVPLRLSREIVDRADAVIGRRHGQGSRNAVLREAILAGLDVLEWKDRQR